VFQIFQHIEQKQDQDCLQMLVAIVFLKSLIAICAAIIHLETTKECLVITHGKDALDKNRDTYLQFNKNAHNINAISIIMKMIHYIQDQNIFNFRNN